MGKYNLKELLINSKPGDFDKNMKYNVTKEDIEEFYRLCCEVYRFEKIYDEVLLGRKEMANELNKKIDLLRQMNEVISKNLNLKKEHYENVTKNLRIEKDQYRKVLEVLKKLASNSSTKYDIRTIEYLTFETDERYGYRSSIEYTGNLTILAEKEALSILDNKDINVTNKYGFLNDDVIKEIYNKGFSMVLFGNDRDTINELRLPFNYFKGLRSPLVFYLQDDELASAAKSFMNFIEDNGADLNNIKESDLIETINLRYLRDQKVKKLI